MTRPTDEPAVRLAHRLPPGTLLADVGGTNARFVSVAADGGAQAPRTLPTRDHVSLEAAMRSYLDAASPPMPVRAAIAVACPVLGDIVDFTNLAWRFSIDGLRDAFGLETLTVINDAAAIAHALPWLAGDDLDVWQPGRPAATPSAMALVAPGTGLGIAALVPAGGAGETRWHAVTGEGGHVTLAARNDVEARIIACLRGRFGHVSAERVVSGPGIANIHAALATLDGADDTPVAPEHLGALLRAGGDVRVDRTFALFAEFLGTVAADTVLTFGATGGLYLAGGILPALDVGFERKRFLARFTDKGRFAALLGSVPVALIRHPFPAFVGLAAILAGGTA